MLDIIIGDALPWLLGIGACVFSVVYAWFSGGRRVKNKQKLDDVNRAMDIGDKADEARKVSAADDRTGDERLRDHGKLRE